MYEITRFNSNSEIPPLRDGWILSNKFKTKGRFIDVHHNRVSSEFEGLKYQIIEKRERSFTTGERIGRAVLGIIAVICTLSTALFSKSVKNLFTNSKECVHFALLVNRSEEKEIAKPKLQQEKENEENRKLQEFYQNKEISSGGELIQLDVDSLDFSEYPNQAEELRKLTKEFVGLINDQISASSPNDTIKTRRYIRIKIREREFELSKLINPGEDEVRKANSFKTDEEYYKATYAGFIMNKLIDLGAIHKIISPNQRGWLLLQA